jgi:hypothetical protein
MRQLSHSSPFFFRQAMKTYDRRSFLASVSCSLTLRAAAPLLPFTQTKSDSPCWLEVCAPFIVDDSERGITAELILTSDTFAGARGHEDGADATEYEILLSDANGRAIGSGGVAKRMTVPAMRTTVIPARELTGGSGSFFGGMKIRLRPRCRETMHASDLFSSAFVRWQTGASFDNVHANPDPLQWQRAQSFYYSMPYPSLADYDCVFSLFNPNDTRSAGEIVMHDPQGRRAVVHRYELRPRASLLLDLNAGSLISDPWRAKAPEKKLRHGGLLAVINDEGTAKSFGYLMIRQPGRERFSVEHPIHQGVFKPRPTVAPFDASGQFRAKNVLYTPLLFRAKKIGEITLETRCHFGTGLPLEEAQWIYPFATDSEGNAVWSAMKDEKLVQSLPEAQTEKGIIRLNAGQSCALDFSQLSLATDFSGGLAVAVAPDTTHTLLKVEARVPEWGAHAFTHFRPGLRSARSYQTPQQRGGLMTDYIVSGARLVTAKGPQQFDELIGVLNIDDQGVAGNPALELFSSGGFVKRVPLGAVPPFACRHYLLSQLIPGEVSYSPLTLRLVDERATLLMSAIHIDHARRDIALDHGSDRFSTFLDYGCR